MTSPDYFPNLMPVVKKDNDAVFLFLFCQLRAVKKASAHFLSHHWNQSHVTTVVT